MSEYRIGSRGDEVKRIQLRLHELGFYALNIDGVFGGGSEAAVKAFQQKNGLDTDGVVGPQTWQKLFDTEYTPPAILKKTFSTRCLALTGCFESGRGVPDCFAAISGNFDKQGLSFGVLQWNFGQGSLQPLLKEMMQQHPDVIRGIFSEKYGDLHAALMGVKEKQIDFALSIQHPVKHFLFEPWKGMFRTLGISEEFVTIQTKAADAIFQNARKLAKVYSLTTQRGVALLFDILVQNGSIRPQTRDRILSHITRLPKDGSEEVEVKKMTIIANRRAEDANEKWREDVRARKLCIAEGSGVVHGISYDLSRDFGITLGPSL